MVALTFLALELITEAAASNSSVLAFVFCNLIIVTILVASKPPPPPSDGESCHVSTMGTQYVTVYALPPKGENRASPSSSESKVEMVILSTHQEEEEEDENCGGEGKNGNGDCNGDCHEVEEEEEEGDDDELRRRVEEFIEKTNREWRAELLRTSRQL